MRPARAAPGVLFVYWPLGGRPKDCGRSQRDFLTRWKHRDLRIRFVNINIQTPVWLFVNAEDTESSALRRQGKGCLSLRCIGSNALLGRVRNACCSEKLQGLRSLARKCSWDSALAHPFCLDSCQGSSDETCQPRPTVLAGTGSLR